jgi:hypothetical protein
MHRSRGRVPELLSRQEPEQSVIWSLISRLTVSSAIAAVAGVESSSLSVSDAYRVRECDIEYVCDRV